MLQNKPRKTRPRIPPVTPEEIARRQAVVADLRAFLERVGPIDLRIEESLREIREDDEYPEECPPRED
jgi:hypothetical protein